MPRQLGDPPGYRGPAVCKMVGVTYRQLDYWARTDLVRPSVAEGHGQGSYRLYSDEDVFVLRAIRRGLDCGIGLQAVRRMVEALREDLTAYWLVITENESVYTLPEFGDLASWLADSPLSVFWILKLAELREANDDDNQP